MNRNDIVEAEIKPIFLSLNTDLYGTPELAEQGWERIRRDVAAVQAQRSREERIAAAERRADREARAHRGLTGAAPTCNRCFAQHRGEC